MEESFFEFVSWIPQWQWAIYFFVFGSIFGSFANVLIYRMQQEEPLNLIKGSYCPQCRYSIPFYLNIPILSWFLLRGRCQKCKAPFSFRYPLVEFLMATFFALLFIHVGWKWFLLELLIFAFGLIVVSFIDFDQMILPDSFTLSGIVLGLLGAGLNSERSFLDAFLGAFLGGFILLLVGYFYYVLRKEEGMGGGDVKLLAWIGAVLGVSSLPFVLIVSSLVGTIVGLILILRDKNQNWKTAIPFGPYLAGSALLYVFFEKWGDLYLQFLFPF